MRGLKTYVVRVPASDDIQDGLIGQVITLIVNLNVLAIQVLLVVIVKVDHTYILLVRPRS